MQFLQGNQQVTDNKPEYLYGLAHQANGINSLMLANDEKPA